MFKLFSNGGMITHCDSFCCFDRASWFVGNDEGPLNLMMNLCDGCKEKLINSIIQMDKEGFLKRITELIDLEKDEERKEMYSGRIFPCKYCDEVFYSPAKLGAHIKSVHRNGGEQDRNIPSDGNNPVSTDIVLQGTEGSSEQVDGEGLESVSGRGPEQTPSEE